MPLGQAQVILKPMTTTTLICTLSPSYNLEPLRGSLHVTALCQGLGLNFCCLRDPVQASHNSFTVETWANPLPRSCKPMPPETTPD